MRIRGYSTACRRPAPCCLKSCAQRASADTAHDFAGACAGTLVRDRSRRRQHDRLGRLPAARFARAVRHGQPLRLGAIDRGRAAARSRLRAHVGALSRLRWPLRVCARRVRRLHRIRHGLELLDFGLVCSRGHCGRVCRQHGIDHALAVLQSRQFCGLCAHRAVAVHRIQSGGRAHRRNHATRHHDSQAAAAVRRDRRRCQRARRPCVHAVQSEPGPAGSA